MRKYFIANLKDGKSASATKTYFSELIPLVKDVKSYISVCPSFESLNSVKAMVKRSNISLGIQNFIDENIDIKDIALVLLGHSSKRRKGETNLHINEKIKRVLSLGLLPVVCFSGESTDDYKREISDELCELLKGVDKIGNIIFAYEPVYAIGTGNTMPVKHIKEIISFIKKEIKEKFKSRAYVLYGGSVSPENCKDILSLKVVDGLLIGAASLDARVFAKICKECDNI